ncbi:restriction endonuclease subunit S [Methanobrevibacter sp.]|uniref:restriction endonuclease subunit S n=1 Tax=Methanobrevibacter sp. TaxID=66852 RepID=UPI0025D2DFEF|nr:restriction endonuclease subunit S [Methanobrevibacter sp.]MBQ6511105.1 restriction endonuclease subunit S [Methanobrevibacter sp.]
MDKVKLKDIADVSSGLSYRRYVDDESQSYKVIVQRSIKKDGILDDFEDIRLKQPKPHYFTRTGDILMKMPYPYDVVCVSQENLVVSDRIAIIRLKKGHNPEFIAHLLTNAHVKKQLYELGSTEKIPHTSIKEIKELELIVPDYEAQVKYGKLLDTINEKIAEDLRLVDYDRNLKEGILNKIWEDAK